MNKQVACIIEGQLIERIMESNNAMSEEAKPEVLEMYSAIICNLSTAIETLRKCVDE